MVMTVLEATLLLSLDLDVTPPMAFFAGFLTGFFYRQSRPLMLKAQSCGLPHVKVCLITVSCSPRTHVYAYTLLTTGLADIDALHPQTKVVLDSGRYKASIKKDGGFTLYVVLFLFPWRDNNHLVFVSLPFRLSGLFRNENFLFSDLIADKLFFLFEFIF
jgi:hypothetical protein